MSMNHKIRAAVLPVVSVCVPDLYTGEGNDLLHVSVHRTAAGVQR